MKFSDLRRFCSFPHRSTAGSPLPRLARESLKRGPRPCRVRRAVPQQRRPDIERRGVRRRSLVNTVLGSERITESVPSRSREAVMLAQVLAAQRERGPQLAFAVGRPPGRDQKRTQIRMPHGRSYGQSNRYSSCRVTINDSAAVVSPRLTDRRQMHEPRAVADDRRRGPRFAATARAASAASSSLNSAPSPVRAALTVQRCPGRPGLRRSMRWSRPLRSSHPFWDYFRCGPQPIHDLSIQRNCDVRLLLTQSHHR